MKKFRKIIKIFNILLLFFSLTFLAGCSFLDFTSDFSYLSSEGIDNLLILEVKSKEEYQVDSFLVDNTLVDDFTYQYKNFIFIFEIKVSFEDDNKAFQEFKISKLYYYPKGSEKTEGNKKSLNLDVKVISFKSLNEEIIDYSKSNLVGIYNYDLGFDSSGDSWGSGIKIKRTLLSNNLVARYRYYVITNRHVVESADIIGVYVTSEYRYRGHKIGYIDNNTDLEMIYFDSLFKFNTLEDQTFDFETIRSYILNQPVYSIGSPGGPKNFNKVATGTIIYLDSQIYFEDSKFCTIDKPCQAIGTTAHLGSGSSGGGLFDAAGNLIGINFAASKTSDISYHIPIEIALPVINAIIFEFEK